MRWMHNEILCLLHFCRPGFLTIHIPPWSSMDLQVLHICRSQRLDMGLKRVSWVRRYQGQCRALRPLGHQGYRLRSYKKDPPLCSGYSLTATEILKRLPCLGGGRKTLPLDQPLLFTVAFVVLCHAFCNNIFNIVGITQARRVCNVLWSAARSPRFSFGWQSGCRCLWLWFHTTVSHDFACKETKISSTTSSAA